MKKTINLFTLFHWNKYYLLQELSKNCFMKVIDRKTKEPLNSKYDDKTLAKPMVYK